MVPKSERLIHQMKYKNFKHRSQKEMKISKIDEKIKNDQML